MAACKLELETGYYEILLYTRAAIVLLRFPVLRYVCGKGACQRSLLLFFLVEALFLL